MVDADKLFSNLQDLKNLMDDYEFLDEEQEEAIRQFFQNFSIERRTELKENSYPSGTNWVLSIIVIGRSLPNWALPTKVCSTGTLSNNSMPTGSNTINTYSSVSTY